MSGATEHLPRLLALVPWLLAHPDTPVGEVAEQFGVDERQVRRDLELIWMCGLPGHGPGDLIDVMYDGDRVSLSNADTISQPLRLTVDEALALVAALRTLLGVPGLVETDAVDRALAKLEGAAGGVGDDVAVATGDAADPDVVANIRQALVTGRRLHLTYWVPARDEATERDVDPIRVFTSEGVPYLVGWCRRVDDLRTFRVDRVLSLTTLDLPAEVPPEARQRALDAGLFTPAAEDRIVTLRLEPAARWVADYYPCETVEERGDGGLVVTLRARDDAWLRRLVLGLAGMVEVTAPAAVAAAVAGDAAVALAQYAPFGPAD
ncbi:MAG TPA: WYL domain-containing protein [Mycobacteriales bacterium]|nr:WYL domain-containing protein [Mycobacteriales bacterium]